MSLNSVIPIFTGSSIPTPVPKKTQEEVGPEEKERASESATLSTVGRKVQKEAISLFYWMPLDYLVEIQYRTLTRISPPATITSLINIICSSSLSTSGATQNSPKGKRVSATAPQSSARRQHHDNSFYSGVPSLLPQLYPRKQRSDLTSKKCDLFKKDEILKSYTIT